MRRGERDSSFEIHSRQGTLRFCPCLDFNTLHFHRFGVLWYACTESYDTTERYPRGIVVSGSGRPIAERMPDFSIPGLFVFGLSLSVQSHLVLKVQILFRVRPAEFIEQSSILFGKRPYPASSFLSTSSKGNCSSIDIVQKRLPELTRLRLPVFRECPFSRKSIAPKARLATDFCRASAPRPTAPRRNATAEAARSPEYSASYLTWVASPSSRLSLR